MKLSNFQDFLKNFPHLANQNNFLSKSFGLKRIPDANLFDLFLIDLKWIFLIGVLGS